MRTPAKRPCRPATRPAAPGADDRTPDAPDAPGASPGPSRAARKHALDVERFRARVASCVDCGSLCMVGAGRLHDWPLDPERMVILAELVGIGRVLRQGVGPADGGYHLCPPSRNAIPDDGCVRLEVAPC